MLCSGALYWTEVASTGLLPPKGRQVVDLFIFTQKSVQGLLCARQFPRSHRGGGKAQKVPTFQGDTLSGEIEIKNIRKLTSFYTAAAAAAAKSLQSCPTLCDPIDGNPPGSPVPGILQARTLEWVADFPGKSTGVGCHCLLRFDELR